MYAVLFCVALGMSYSVAAGMWGIVVADLVEMVFMVGGALVLAYYCLAHEKVGGLAGLVAQVPAKSLAMLPADTGGFMASPFWWLVGMLAIQWWAWKNTDGGGMVVQKMAACKDEKNAVYATLWYNVVHNALRIWPWAIVALASIVLLPDGDPRLVDPVTHKTNYERAYPILFNELLPKGLRGLVVASFFAAFMSSVSAMTNWGASYVVNDFYRRFVKKDGSDQHYVRASRIATLAIMGGTILSAYFTKSIGDSFTFVLKITSGVGVVFLLRWFWWRVNAWSEIAALAASIPAILLEKPVKALLHIETTAYSSIWNLSYMVVATGIVWVPVTLLTRPVSLERLQDFYRKVRPPAFGWRPIAEMTGVSKTEDGWLVVFLWLVGIVFIYSATFGIGQLLIGDRRIGAGLVLLALATLGVIMWKVRDLPAPKSEEEPPPDGAQR